MRAKHKNVLHGRCGASGVEQGCKEGRREDEAGWIMKQNFARFAVKGSANVGGLKSMFAKNVERNSMFWKQTTAKGFVMIGRKRMKNEHWVT